MKRAGTSSIGRQLGGIYLLVVALLAGVCGVVAAQLGEMRADSARLVEETEEHAATSRLLALLDSLSALVDSWSPATDRPELRARSEELLREVRSALARLHGDPRVDPSRPEHQRAEDRLAVDLGAHLEAVTASLRGRPSAAELDAARAALREVEREARGLHAETRHESRAAFLDLTARAARSRKIMLATLAAAALALGIALFHVLRVVVRPIRRLQHGAERLGAGELGLRLPERGRDEIGQLSRAFNSMAERVAHARSDLEARVEARTREFLRAARLADLGVLAAGVAHEVNNPLASIASCAEGLERRLRSGGLGRDEELEYLRTIASEAYRARSITTQLLSLASHEADAPGPVDVHLVLRQVEMAARHLLEKKGVRLVVEEQPVELVGSAAELMQVLTNLVLNARDAAPPGSTVTLRCGPEGDRVVFEVVDEGEGVPPELRERIFEPFFTTKRAGKGTGLGLSVVGALVQGRGGRVTVDGAPGGGARFRVELPAAGVSVP